MGRIVVGSTKGLIFLGKSDGNWKIKSVHFKGLPISMIHYDRQGGTWWVALSIKHWGPKLFMSTDDGNTWQERNVPQYPAASSVKTGLRATLKLIWSGLYTPHNNRLWLGTEPGGLFFSDDHGLNFQLCDALWNHRSRPEHWFGGGRNQAGIHTIEQDPLKLHSLIVGVSCAGVFQTDDEGISWEGRNRGLRADYLPDPHSEFGHDPHAIKICHSNPDVIWQQNHCGVFRSTDRAITWTDVTDQDEWGRYGFPIVIDHSDPNRAWIIPAESDEQRVAKNQRLVVCTTTDGGKSWRKITSGLPQEDCFDLVFRHAFEHERRQMVFGTTTGHLFFSEDLGENWTAIAGFLPPIHIVQFASE